MDNFKRVNGRQTISGNVVRIDVEKQSRNSDVFTETVLSNGKSVRFVADGMYLGIFTGKGARHILVHNQTKVKVYVDNVEVAIIGAADLDKFTVTV
jgi:hypothetical protein